MKEPPPHMDKRWEDRALGVPGVLLFGHYHFLAARSGLEPHQHDGALEICYLVRGEQTYRVGGRKYRLRGGDQFVTYPGEWHDTAGEPQQKGELFWVIIQCRRPPPDTLFLVPSQHRMLLRDLRKLPNRHFRGAADALPSLIKCEAALDDAQSGRSRLEFVAALQQYLLGTLRSSQDAVREPPGQRVREAINWMEAHLHEPIRIREMADAVGWSEAHFKTVFRQDTGQTPHDFLLKRKVARAQSLLAGDPPSITRLAHELGFSSSQHFATIFKKFTGETPSNWKRTRSTA